MFDMLICFGYNGFGLNLLDMLPLDMFGCLEYV